MTFCLSGKAKCFIFNKEQPVLAKGVLFIILTLLSLSTELLYGSQGSKSNVLWNRFSGILISPLVTDSTGSSGGNSTARTDAWRIWLRLGKGKVDDRKSTTTMRLSTDSDIWHPNYLLNFPGGFLLPTDNFCLFLGKYIPPCLPSTLLRSWCSSAILGHFKIDNSVLMNLPKRFPGQSKRI